MTEFVEKVQIVGADGTPLTVNADGSIDVSGAGGGGAPADAQYYVAASDPTLSAEIVVPAFMQTLLDDTDAATARSTLGVAYSQLAGYEIGYDQITSASNVTSTTESSGDTIISCAAHTFDGSPVMADVFFPQFDLGALSNGELIVSLFESTTQIGRLLHLFCSNGAVQIKSSLRGGLRFTPSAGSHTYTVTAFKSGAMTVALGGGASGTGAYVPAYVRFTKV